jgi:capsular polysaccharide biosynthesis protein
MDPSYQGYAEDEESSPLDLKVLVLYGLFRSKLWIGLLAALGLVGGLIAGAASPNEYESEARLRYVPGERDKLTDDDLAGLQGGDRRNAAPGIADELMLLENPLIYQRVAERLGASAILHVPDPTRNDSSSTAFNARLMHQLQKALVGKSSATINDGSDKAHTAAWRRLQGSTTLVTVRNAATIRVLVRAYTPERAQQFCAELVDAFQERHREVFSAEARLEDQRQRVSDAMEKYQKCEADWNQYREDCGVFNFNQANQANQQKIEDNNEEEQACKRERTKLLEKITLYEKRANEVPEFKDVHVDPLVGANPDLGALRKQQSDLRRQLLLLVPGSIPPNQLEQRRKETELQLERVEEEIQATEPTIEFIPAHTVREINPEFTELKAELLRLRSELLDAIEDIKWLMDNGKALAEDRKSIAACKDIHSLHSGLVEDARRDLTTQQGQLSKLEKLALAEMKGASALKPYWSPTLPLTKFGPSRVKPLLMGFALGLALGVGLAVLRQLADRRLRYPETLEKAMGLPVIGVIPEVRSLRGLHKANGQGTA